MTPSLHVAMLALATTSVLLPTPATAQRPTSRTTPQPPALAGAAPTSSRDRVYTGDQTSNTVSVIDAGTNTFLGTIALGDPRPAVLGALYKKQIGVHGLGFSPDGKWLAAVSVTSNAVTLIETATNKVRGTSTSGGHRTKHSSHRMAENCG